MMYKFNRLEKLYGVRKTSDFTRPKIVNGDDFQFPYNSAVIEYNRAYIGSSNYKGLPTPINVFMIDRYPETFPGKYRRVSLKSIDTINRLKQNVDTTGFKFVLRKEQLWRVSESKTIIFDVNNLKDFYKYKTYRGAEYDAFMNKFKTVLINTIEPDRITDRTIFIPITIPRVIPKVSEIKRLLNYKGYNLYNRLEDKNMLIILEFIRALRNEPSVFDIIKNKEESDVVFLFTIGNKYTFVRDDYLFSLNAANGIESPIHGGNADFAIRTFLKYILLTSTSATKSIKELENSSSTDVKLVEDKADIDILIDAHNETYKSVDIAEEVKVESIPLKKILEKKTDIIDTTKEAINNKVNYGVISETTKKKMESALSEQKETLKELVISKKEIELPIEQYPDSDVIIDKNMTKNTVEAFDKYYIDHIYKKQQAQMVFGIQRSGNVISNYDVDVKEDINNSLETHNITIIQPTGRSVNTKIIVPKLDSNGSLKINNNIYKMRKQKVDIPIRKISPTQVALTSYYSKIFIRKAEVNTNNSGYDIYKSIRDRVGVDISVLVTGKSEVFGTKLPNVYTLFSRYIKSFRFKGIYFNFVYSSIESLFSKSDKLIIGKKGNELFYLDENGNIYSDKVDKTPLLDFLKIDVDTIRPEYANIYLLGQRIPLIIPIMYYNGFRSVLKSLNCRYREVDGRVTLEKFEYPIKFKDTTFVLDRRDGVATILFAGLSRIKELRTIDSVTLDTKNGVLDFMFLLNYGNKIGTELNNLNSLWVDPITESILEEIKEPTTFIGLLFRSAELLKDGYSKGQNDTSQILIKGYERLNGMVYNVLTKSIRDYEHKLGKIQTKISVNPYEVLGMLSEDSTIMLEEDINPIEMMKMKEDITLTGKFGRDKAGVSIKDRVYDKSNVGIISEASKDSKDIGITSYLSAVPKLDNIYGIIRGDYQKDLTTANIYSSSMNLAAESTRDDGKRAMYISIQNKHLIPTENARVFPVLTGYERIIPYRMEDKFVTYADKAGVVLDVSKREVVIRYGKDTKRYPLKNWTSKEANGLTYTHRLVSDLVKGDKVDKFDIIMYDELFFGPDILNRKRIVYKAGEIVRVALDESPEVYEDSAAISLDYSKRHVSKVTKVRSIIINKDMVVTHIAKLNQYIKYNDPLISFVDSMIDGDLGADLSDTAKSILSDLKNNAPKAKTKGTLTNIKVFYNCDKEEMSPTIKTIVESSDKKLKSEEGFTGRVDNTYSIKGKPLLENDIEIKFYIEKEVGLELGDKEVLGNQLKFTVGDIFNLIKTETGETVDVKFGYRSIGARIVESPYTLGTTMLILEDLDKRILKEYFE